MTNQNKLSPLKVLLLAISVIILAWLAVMIINFLPSTFSYLANLAEDVQYGDVENPELQIETNATSTSSGQELALEWNQMEYEGEYMFSYECKSGLSAEIKNQSGNIVSLECGSDHLLPQNTNKTSVRFFTEEDRTITVDYQIYYIPNNKDVSKQLARGEVRVTNPSISGRADRVANDTDTPAELEANVYTGLREEDVANETPQYREVAVTTYEVPESDPNGYSDLTVEYVGVGILDNANQFSPRNSLQTEQSGAIRFKVTNVGTKTSENWLFRASLEDKEEVNGSKSALKPQESEVITLNFPYLQEDGLKDFAVSISNSGDANQSNNRLETEVLVR